MPKIIAEIGVNHNKSYSILKELIIGAKDAGADYVKFQRFVSADEISEKADLANYQKNGDMIYKSQLEMARNLEMPDKLLIDGINLCKKYKINPLCSPFEIKSINFIKNTLNLSMVKVPSPEITNVPYLKKIASSFEKIFLSTGASHIWEIGYALDLLFEINPKLEITLLHCISEYPAPYASLNLKCIKNLSETFNLPVGFSDHSQGFIGSLAALSIGAKVIEKHITLDQNLPGPDHKASASLGDLAIICDFAKKIEFMMGDGIKKPSDAEKPNKDLIRKSAYINVSSIKKGDVFSDDLYSCKRPFNPSLISPENIEMFIGYKFNKNKKFDDGISLSDFTC